MADPGRGRRRTLLVVTLHRRRRRHLKGAGPVVLMAIPLSAEVVAGHPRHTSISEVRATAAAEGEGEGGTHNGGPGLQPADRTSSL